jgi:hypothetical protein
MKLIMCVVAARLTGFHHSHRKVPQRCDLADDPAVIEITCALCIEPIYGGQRARYATTKKISRSLPWNIRRWRQTFRGRFY